MGVFLQLAGVDGGGGGEGWCAVKKWEYLVNTYVGKNDDEMQAELDELGGGGWELVSMKFSEGWYDDGTPRWLKVYLKRPV